MSIYEELYEKILKYYTANGYKVHQEEKDKYTKVIGVESLGLNSDMLALEFDTNNNVLEILFLHKIKGLDELVVYKNVNEANLVIDDGVIIYSDNTLILRSIYNDNEPVTLKHVLANITYLQIVATSYFASIISLAQPK